MNKKDTLKQICKMISSGEIPQEIYNKYLSKTQIGFMCYKDLCNYFNLDSKIADYKYASEMEGKYVVSNYIVTEFEKWLEEEINTIEKTYSQINGNYMRMQPVLDTFKKIKLKLQELKEGNK